MSKDLEPVKDIQVTKGSLTTGQTIADNDQIIDEKIIFEMEDEIFNTCKTFSMKNKNQEKSLIEIVKQNCRKIIKDKTGKKPFTNINIARL